jgi:hypothetical protein
LVTQQYPSTQKPVAQSTAFTQVWPIAFLQLPSVSHDLVPEQVSESVTPPTIEQVPGMGEAHERHAVVQSFSQQ